MRTPKASDRARIAAAALLSVLLVWPLLTRGFLGDADQFFAFWNATAALGAVVVLGFLERRPFALTPARVGAFALWLAYAVAAVFVAVAPREAILEVVKHGVYLFTFVTASELVLSCRARDDDRPEAVARRRITSPEVIALAAWAGVALMALVSLVGAVGLLRVDVVAQGRLFSLVGYPNSTGSLTGAALLLGMGVRQSSGIRRNQARNGRLVEGLTDVGQWALATAFVLSMSRGAWLFFPVAFAATLAVWPAGRRLAAAGDLAFAGLAAIALSPFLIRSFGRPWPGAGLLAAGVGAALLGGWLARRFQALPPRRQLWTTAAVLTAGVVLAAGLVLTRSVPSVLMGRLLGFSLSERGAWERIEWSRDALAMVKDYPILGLGGGGWASRYYQYQHYGYHTREVHNGYADIWLETGTVGFLAFLVLLGGSALSVWRLTRRRPGGGEAGRSTLAALSGAAALLVLHAPLDIDLELVCLGGFLWSALGLIDGLWLAEGQARAPAAAPVSRATKRDRRRRPKLSPGAVWSRVALLAVGLALSLVVLGLYAGLRANGRAIRLFDQNRPTDGLATFKRASQYDPWSPLIRENYAQALESFYTRLGRPEYLEQAFVQMEAAVRLDPYHPTPHAERGDLALRHDQYELAVTELGKAKELQPFEVKRYQDLAQAEFLYGIDLIRKGDVTAARPHLLRAASMVDELSARAVEVPSYVPEASRLVAVSPPVSLWAGKAEALLGNWDEAARLLGEAHDFPLVERARETDKTVKERRAEAALWLSMVEERRGGPRAAEYLAEARASVPDTDARRASLSPLLGKAGTP